jgi:hypothetical protein
MSELAEPPKKYCTDENEKKKKRNAHMSTNNTTEAQNGRITTDNGETSRALVRHYTTTKVRGGREVQISQMEIRIYDQ